MNLQGRSLKKGLDGDDVRSLHAELARLNVVIPVTESRSARFGAGTVAAVKRFQKAHGLRASGIVDTATVNAINLAVGAVQPTTYTVSGRVYSALRAGVGGLRVAAVDKNAGPDVPLAEGVTADGGGYSIQYSTAAVLRHGKTAPDLQVCAFRGDTFVAASEVRYNASPNETLDVVVPDATAPALHAEFETLTGAIAKHFKGNLADLQETASPGTPEQRSDITYLANKTGWDARAVALAALADQFSRRSGTGAPIAPAFFYALFRAGLPANEDHLYSLDSASLTKIWTAAAEQGVIPPSATAQIPKVAKLFQTASTKRLLTAPARAGVSSIKDMLSGVSKLSAPQSEQFAALYAANRNDMPAFWTAVTATFGGETAARLQLDGKLAFLTLNNAPLMQAVKQIGGQRELTDPVDLALAGYHRADKWKPLLTANTSVPPEIPGATPDAKLMNYADYLAAQVRLSYPTASVAEMVKVGVLRVQLPDQVTKFLTAQQDRFVIGAEPIQRYVARTGTEVSDRVVAEIKRIERLYQITPSDQAMSLLLKRGIDSAYHIAQQDREIFIQSLAADIGADQATAVYARAVQVQNAVLNIVVGYVTARNGVNLGAAPLTAAVGPGTSSGQILRPAPTGSAAANPDVIAYPTLEKLFGSMDYCACDHCRSVLSPAAYLVDLLQFIDKEPPAPAPLETPKLNPQAVLFARRPDIQHLPLTCENTNTALPYIDIVNEALEYYVANTGPQPSLDGYQGHDTGSAASEDLMASPRYVMDTAYDILRGALFPPPLPFNRPLESLRLHFEKLEVPLGLAMERLRKTDDIERGANPYGWRDILMEELGISREEYRLLADGSLSLAAICGFPPGGTDDETIEALSNAKVFCRRIGISYEDLVAILRTRFVNPNSDLIPKLQRLGVPFATVRDLHDGSITDAAFAELLPQGVAAPVAAEYGGDIKAWVKDPANFARIMSIIVLAGPAETAGECDFGTFELRYSRPAATPPDNRLHVADFVRLLRFIRLWRKLGWSIDHVDAAICALFRGDLTPLTATDLATVPDLDAGFSTLLPRLGEAVRVMRALGVKPAAELLPMLACWSSIGTHGEASLYGRLFLNQAIVAHDPAFADDGYGNVPAGSADTLETHTESLRAALTLTAEEFALIAENLSFDANTKLTLANITAVYHRGWLARKLRVSVRELLLLSSLTGLDPFARPDPPEPPISRFIALVQSMKARALRLSSALYLVWNRDPSGKAAPTAAKAEQFARNLRAELAAIDDQFALVEDPGGDVAHARLALVYGPETADAFFGLADNTVVLNVDGYTHPSSALEPGVVAADDRLSYDDFQHRLSHVGLLAATTRDALKAVAGVSAAFKAAVDALFARGEDLSGAFFARFPELKAAYDEYVASTAPPEEKRAALLAAFSPELAKRRKAQQALQSLATAASVDVSFAEALLDPAQGPFPLHAAGDPSRSVIHDVTAIGTPGLAAAFFFADTATGAVDEEVAAAANLAYSSTTNPLPANPTHQGLRSPVSGGAASRPRRRAISISSSRLNQRRLSF